MRYHQSMSALILATCCSAAIALVFKYSETRGLNRYIVTSTNYLTASLVSLVMLLLQPTGVGLRQALPAFAAEASSVLPSGGIFSAPASVAWAALLGILTGCFYFLGFIYLQESVRVSGAGLSGAFGKMGILVPMLLSLLLWRELPGPWQWVGIALALGSMTLVYLPIGQQTASQFHAALLLLFCFSGTGEFANKLFQKYSLVGFKNLYLLCVFGTALAISLYFSWRQCRLPQPQDLLTGLAVGIPNLFSSYFLIAALGRLPASVAYPIYSAGSILLINLGSTLIFRERLSRRQLSSIGLTMLALALINL